MEREVCGELGVVDGRSVKCGLDRDHSGGHKPEKPVKRVGWTAGRLRAAMKDVPDSMEVIVRASSVSDESICGGIHDASVTTGCVELDDGDAVEFFAIEVSDDVADFEETDR